MNTETIATIALSAFSSGFLSTVLVKVIDNLHEDALRKFEEKKKIIEKKEQFKDDYIAEKKAVYIEALKKLAEIRVGFDYTRDGLKIPEHLRKRIDEINENASELSAKLRLYSSDDIYNVYWNLAQWSKFSYAGSVNSWRLGSRSKELFSLNTTFLARLMQVDLGYRDFVLNPEKVVCPKCQKEHDAYKACKCGMTWSQTIEEIQKPLREEWEKRQKELLEQENSTGGIG